MQYIIELNNNLIIIQGKYQWIPKLYALKIIKREQQSN